MKTVHTTRLAVLAATAWALALTAAAIERGMTRDAVVAELGRPDGAMKSGETEWLQYERGRVHLEGGRVVEFDLITPEELRRKQVVAAARVQREHEETTARIRQRIADGLRVRSQLMASPVVAAANGEQQVRLWQSFMDKYPEVDVNEPWLAAVRKRDDEAEQARARAEENDLKARALAAEWRALDAERQLQTHQAANYYWQQGYYGQYGNPSYGVTGYGLYAPPVTVYWNGGSSQVVLPPRKHPGAGYCAPSPLHLEFKSPSLKGRVHWNY